MLQFLKDHVPVIGLILIIGLLFTLALQVGGIGAEKRRLSQERAQIEIEKRAIQIMKGDKFIETFCKLQTSNALIDQ